MKIKWMLLAGISLILLGWLWASGRLEALFLTLAGLVGVGAGATAKKYTEEKRETDEILEQINGTLGDTAERRARHEEEVKQIEGQDFSGVPIADLIHGANERESRRGNTTIR